MIDGRIDRGPRVSRARMSLALALASVWLASCATSALPRKARAFEPPTVVSSSVTFAPAGAYPETEIEQLADLRTAAARLRRAWLELQMRRPQAALDAAAEVLYGSDRLSANDESFARYVRAEAFRQQGFPERGTYDLEKARQLALDPGLQARIAPAAPATPGKPAAALPSLAIEPRESWSPRKVDMRSLDAMQRPRRVTIHHSAVYFRDTRARAAAAQISNIQREHMQQRGYGDIGYHFLIDPSGRIWEGRELRWQGAHAKGDNNVANIGICLLGNFMRQGEGQGPTDAQVRSMEQLVVQLMRRYGFGADALYCHSDFRDTVCPGPRMEPIVRQLARQLQVRGPYLATAEEDEE